MSLLLKGPSDEVASKRSKYVVFPVCFPDIYEMYRTAVSAFWRPEEIDFSKDADDFKKLSPDEQHFISHVLAFFAASDGIVNENLASNFMQQVNLPEAELFYSFQIAMEGIHSVTYSLLIERLIERKEDKDYLFQAIETIPCVKKKANWAIDWILAPSETLGSLSGPNPLTDFLARLVAFACVEGIFFSGAFCAIFWIKERGILPGLCTSNEFISRDENMHTEFACLLYRKYVAPHEKLPESVVYQIVRSATETEFEFVCESLPVRLLGMNADDMCEYIKYIANRLLFQLGLKEPLYPNAKNPFPFMHRLGLENKTNFFEGIVTEYSMHKNTELDERAFDTLNMQF